MSRSYRRPFLAVLVLGLLGALVVPATAAASRGSTRTYLVTVENLTDSQPFTPPVVVAHKRNHDVFTVGDAAMPGIQGVAENGDVPGLVAEQSAAPGVGTVTVAGGPVLPGGSVSFEIEARPGRRWASIASMLICTNDGFTGVDGVRLPKGRGETIVIDAGAYDAGTEINTEDVDDLVPPCGVLTGLHDGTLGTGMRDPALAEGGVITSHPGIAGIADLSVDPYDWDDPVARITITRID